MLKFDFKSIDDFKMLLDEKCITVETPDGKTVYQCEDWKRAYGDFFVAAANYLTDREDWAYAYDFLKVRTTACEERTLTNIEGEIPIFENTETSSREIIDDFELIKKDAYRRAYEKRQKSLGKDVKSDLRAKDYDGIVDNIAFSAMQKVWYLYLEKQMTLEQARDESLVVFREYRRLRLMMTAMEQYEKRTFESYKRLLKMRQDTTGMFLTLLNGVDNMTDVEIIDRLISLVAVQSGEDVSANVLRRKLEEKREREANGEEFGIKEPTFVSGKYPVTYVQAKCAPDHVNLEYDLAVGGRFI